MVSIFAVVDVWKDFLWPLLVEGGHPPRRAQRRHLRGVGLPENVFIAALAMASVPTVIFFLIFQRNIMSGLTAGSLRAERNPHCAVHNTREQVPLARHHGSGDWWRSAAIYQVYVRSFADGNGDGVGDLAGVRARLRYLADLGVDAIWFNPWFPSPMADAGYDIADYRGIDPAFGTLAEADALIAEAHELGIKIIIDIVPNHCSDRHAWFQAALAAEPGSAARARFWFRPGRGPAAICRRTTGSRSSAARPGPGSPSRTASPASGTCTCSRREQPDFNWENPEVREEFEDVLRFWFDRGADGFRIDSAALLVKDPLASRPGPDDRPGARTLRRPRRHPRDLPGLARGRRLLPRPRA